MIANIVRYLVKYFNYALFSLNGLLRCRLINKRFNETPLVQPALETSPRSKEQLGNQRTNIRLPSFETRNFHRYFNRVEEIAKGG